MDGARPSCHHRPVVGVAPTQPDLRELARYARRVQDRWPLECAVLGGTRVGGTLPGPDAPAYLLVLVSPLFDGVPWLERVHQATALWDATAMGGAAEVHCYTPVELERRRTTLRSIQQVLAGGVDLLALRR